MATPLVDVVTIGTELTRGEIVDTNAAWLGTELHRRGFAVGVHTTVADDRAAMRRALAESAARAVAVLVSGGLGPTMDDFTAEVAAEVCGVPLARDDEALTRLTARLTGFGLAVTPNNAKQADVPAGARVLQNEAGTAPGFVTPAAQGRAPMYFMPGVPRELQRMFERQVAPDLEARFPERDAVAERRLRVFGTGESTVDFMLKKQIEAFVGAQPGPASGDAAAEVAFRASWPEILVTFRARAASPEAARAKVDRIAEEARGVLGPHVYGEGDAGLAEVVGAELRARALRVAVAESCTGGELGAMLTAAAGASDYFAGGVIAYADQVKTGVLGVPEDVLRAHGAVSEPVVRAMAERVADLFGVSAGIAISGVAGPGGGTPDKPVGTVHWAVALRLPGEAPATLHGTRRMRGDRGMIRRISAFAALRLLLGRLRGETVA
ncbi:MAG TPA: CinA family nicotinamide mononucleotide deamidase-related protein [Myxococcota bacterium]|nr:CinA family nicotinamide mononucleotide deamidase-related protein [Myxococcota bacterium]